MKQDKNKDTQKYEPPAVIYKGSISTRAGSGGCHHERCDDVGEYGVDPANLFDN